MKKVVVTGSNGLLGQTLVRQLLEKKGQYEVHGLSRGENRSGRNDFFYHDIDLTQRNMLVTLLKDITPDVIVNTAAMTQVDQCEDDKATCDLLNIEVVKWISEVATEIDAHIVHLSTDFVFDGEKGNYKESDTPNPISYYGLSKLKAEQVLENSKAHFAILRTILVYGKVYDMSRTNIVLWVRKMLSEKKEITIVNDQYRMPTYVEDLALGCILAIEKRAKGIYNISSSQLLSVYEIASQVAAVFDLDASLIKPISSTSLNQKANRPPRTGFDLTKSAQELGYPLTTFAEDLQRFKLQLS